MEKRYQEEGNLSGDEDSIATKIGSNGMNNKSFIIIIIIVMLTMDRRWMMIP